MSFDVLPDEIILQIFSLLSLKQIQTKLRSVNNRWKRLADDDSHYRKLILKSNVPSTVAVQLLRKYHKSIKYLQLLERTDVNQLAPLIEKCSNLQSLTLTLCYGNGEDLTEALKSCRHLNTLIMHHSECVRNVSDLLDVVSEYPMKKINLRNVQTPDYIRFWRLENVEDLRLKSVNVDCLSIIHFCHNNRDSLITLKLIPSNEDISLHYSVRADELNGMLGDIMKTSKEYFELIMQFIGRCQNLRSLCLGPLVARSIDDDLIVNLGNLNSLSTLVLHQANSVTDVGFSKLFREPLSKNLTKISLHKCLWVTSSVLKTIACNCMNLEKFIFEKCKHTQTNQDYEDILVLAKSCKKLKKLHLFGMDICVAHILHLLPEQLPELYSLQFSNDSEPMNVPSFLQKLEEKMPDFNVSGLQWKFNLHVNCKRKKRLDWRSNDASKYVCSMDLKTQANFV